MKKVQVLGTDCAKCKSTVELLNDVAESEGVSVDVQKVEDIAEIMSMGVMSTPGVVIDGTLVHSGSMPARAQVVEWLKD
ncbi:MTH895/ArsE family thioredoxin-like protein [Guyparkeria halopsychrophila]|uniref:thioredoxin family protein n=1 Tax=Guyparkeria halopsychrophila TaxID=3139421 RepID=UPI0037CB455B